MKSAAGNRNSVAGMGRRRIKFSSAVVVGTVLVTGASAASWAQGQTYSRFGPGRGGQPLRHHLWRRRLRLWNHVPAGHDREGSGAP